MSFPLGRGHGLDEADHIHSHQMTKAGTVEGDTNWQAVWTLIPTCLLLDKCPDLPQKLWRCHRLALTLLLDEGPDRSGQLWVCQQLLLEVHLMNVQCSRSSFRCAVSFC